VVTNDLAVSCRGKEYNILLLQPHPPNKIKFLSEVFIPDQVGFTWRSKKGEKILYTARYDSTGKRKGRIKGASSTLSWKSRESDIR